MFLAWAPAWVDEKGRIKLPEPFRQKIDDIYGSREFFSTSFDGRTGTIYP